MAKPKYIPYANKALRPLFMRKPKNERWLEHELETTQAAESIDQTGSSISQVPEEETDARGETSTESSRKDV